MIITTRAEWGARHPRGFRPSRLPATELWLHHSVTIAPDLVPPFDDEHRAMRTLEQIGQDRFGGGISYTFAVMPNGRVYEGHGVDREGAHTAGHNSAGRGIVLVGNYDSIAPSAAMLNGVAELLAHGKRVGWWTAAELDGGHRDTKATACPGGAAYRLIPEINRRAALLLHPPAGPRPPGSGPSPGPIATPQLTHGMRNHPAVRRVQLHMRTRFPSYAGHLVADGDYGDQTARVIADFQSRVRITGPDANGRTIGPRTWSALIQHGYR